MAACSLVEVYQTCAKPVMEACGRNVLPPVEDFFIYHLKRLGWIKDKHLIPAGDLILHDPTDTHWVNDDTRFKEKPVAVLKHGTQSFEIKAAKKFDLVPGKTYVVYLIFKTTPGPGHDAVLTATVSTETDESKDVCLTKNRKVHADQKLDDLKLPVNSSYVGWMELELGEFECPNNPTKRVEEVRIEVKENNKHIMRPGVYVAGIELRSN